MATIGNQDKLMTAPVLSSRVPVFSPSLKVGMTDWSVRTVYGCTSVKGNLTQVHRNILDTMFGFALKSRALQNGALELLIDPFIIARETGSSRDYKWMRSKLHDMKQADVQIIDAEGLVVHFGGIVSEVREAKVRASLPGGALQGDRPLMAITISSAWMRLHNSTLSVDYRDLLYDITKLKSGVLQALTRYCITQMKLNKKLETVLEEIGAITTSTSRSQRYEILKQVKEADLSIFGIEIVNEVVLYKKHRRVFFRNPSNKDSPAICADSPAICADSPAICADSPAICAAPQELSRAIKSS